MQFGGWIVQDKDLANRVLPDDHETSQQILSPPPCAGVLTLLKFPYPRDVEEPECYDEIRVHAEWGTSQTLGKDNKQPSFAVREALCLVQLPW